MKQSNIYQDNIPNFPPVLTIQRDPDSERIEIIKIIKKCVCEVYGLRFEDIDVRERSKEIVEQRQQVMFFMRKYTQMSLREIGCIFAKKYHYSTVIHALQTIDNLMSYDRRVVRKYEAIDFLIKQMLND